jgi:alpha-tubulin suppressor-like RCC1 family protein
MQSQGEFSTMRSTLTGATLAICIVACDATDNRLEDAGRDGGAALSTLQMDGGGPDSSSPRADDAAIDAAATPTDSGRDAARADRDASPSGKPTPDAAMDPPALPDAGPRRSASLAAGGGYTCARSRDGKAYCWGDVLGTLGVTNFYEPQVFFPAEPVSGLAEVVEIVARNQACALMIDGKVGCWEGSAQNYPASTIEATPQAGVMDAKQLGVGGGFTCSVQGDGQVGCWGRNHNGQLGRGSKSSLEAFGYVPGLTNVIKVATGGQHACALLQDGRVSCWGSNTDSQLAIKNLTDRPSPELIADVSDAVDITAGVMHTCVLAKDATIKCWRSNRSALLGQGGTGYPSTPVVRVKGLTDVVEIAAGVGLHMCARTRAGEVFCWGLNSDGQLGNGTDDRLFSPVRVSGLVAPVELAVGGAHSCARLADESIWCWGRNEYKQLGDGTQEDRYLPVQSQW